MSVALRPAGKGDNKTPVAWPPVNATIVLRNGDKALYRGVCPVSGRHCAVVPRVWGDLAKGYTTWLLDDCGRCRCSPGPSDHDYLPSQQGAPA